MIASNQDATISPLINAAIAARANAHAPYSNFQVGAALETAEGKIFVGCNIENATYGLTMCAERVALYKALSEGYRKFTRICIATDTARPTPPCGSCRQLLWEFGGNLEVFLSDLKSMKVAYRLEELLPHAFDATNLK